MHDPKFEKEVQQKMEELKFSPSEAVWTKLEKDLQKEKRRALPLFWLFFLVGGMLLGAGATWLFYTHGSHAAVPSSPELSRNSPGSADPQNAIVAQPAAVHRVPVTGRTSATPPATPSTTLATPSTTPATPSTTPAATPSAKSATMPFASTTAPAFATKARKFAHTRPGLTITTPANELAASHATGSETGLAHQNIVSGLATSGSKATPIGGDEDDQSEMTLRRSWVRELPTQVGSGFNGNRITPVSKDIPANALAKNSTAKKPRLYKAPVWEAGFAGGTGISGANKGFFQPTTSGQLSAISASGPTPAYLFNTTGIAPSTRNYYSPTIGSGLSFWAGIFVQKPVVKKLSLSLGLNVHYYSTRVATGQVVANNPSAQSNSLFYSSIAAASSPSYPYYPTGNSYSYLNRYYFLELPVSLQWQVNPGRKIPLFWEGGFSLTRLMSANALYYNESSGVYYKYGGQPNPVRLYASTAFMAGLRWRDTRIQLGPEFQYGLTRLSNENSNSGQHLFYGGIKITVVPGRK